MLGLKLGSMFNKNKSNETTKTNKKIENLIFFVILLIVTLIIINSIWNTKENSTSTIEEDKNVVNSSKNSDNSIAKAELEQKLENILSTIKNVGEVSVFINYSESSSVVPLYDETTTTSSTEEGDSSGGTRNVTETETQKEVVFSEKSSDKEPVTQKTTMPIIQGAIVTADGASDAMVKTNITNAVQAVTGLSIDKIQVFEKAKIN